MGETNFPRKKIIFGNILIFFNTLSTKFITIIQIYNSMAVNIVSTTYLHLETIH